MTTPSVAACVLTRGDRPATLAALAASIDGEPFAERLLLANGAPADLAGWTTVHAPENLGVPGGRQRLVEAATSDVLVFLDDDAVVLTSPDGDGEASGLVATLAAEFAAHPRLGAVGLRLTLPDATESQRQHNPRLGSRGADTPGAVTSFLGGAVALRRAAVTDAGGYWPDLFLFHEETDLAWRLLDRGWDVRYDPTLVLAHPASPPTRHADGLWRGARNRVWIARRNLPLVLVPIYTGLWTLVTLARCRRRHEVAAVVGGVRAGMGPLPASRRPMRWRTVWELTRRGRPPIL